MSPDLSFPFDDLVEAVNRVMTAHGQDPMRVLFKGGPVECTQFAGAQVCRKERLLQFCCWCGMLDDGAADIWTQGIVHELWAVVLIIGQVEWVFCVHGIGHLQIFKDIEDIWECRKIQ